MANKIHNFSSDTIQVALSNTAPIATNTVIGNISEISYVNISARALTTVSSAQSSGLYSFIVNDLLLNASGSVGPFRYVVLYNITASAKNLIAWYDYGSSITLGSGDTFNLDFDNVNGVFQLQ